MEYRKLEITLQYAQDLNNVNLISKMDVYAVVSISGGDKNWRQETITPVDRGGHANPNWNFTMNFTVEVAVLQQNCLTLVFRLVCKNAFGDKDIGEVHVPIKELLHSTAAGKKFVSYQVRKPNGKPKGQLSFSYQFGEQTAAATPPPMVAGKYDSEPVMAYPVTGISSVYPPPDKWYGQPYGAAEAAGGPYPPVAGYTPAGGAPFLAYPPHLYVYPPPPPGNLYPHPAAGHGYPPPPLQKPARKNKFGMGLGAGLLGGAIGGLLIGDMISDATDFDCGGGFYF